MHMAVEDLRRRAVYAVIVGLMFFNPALRRMDARLAASHAPTPAEGSPAEASTQARSSATMKAGL